MEGWRKGVYDREARTTLEIRMVIKVDRERSASTAQIYEQDRLREPRGQIPGDGVSLYSNGLSAHRRLDCQKKDRRLGGVRPPNLPPYPRGTGRSMGILRPRPK